MAKPTYCKPGEYHGHDTVEAAHLCYIARLLAENERLRALLARFTPEYRQIINPVEGSPEYVSMVLPRAILAEIRAALKDGAK